MKRIALHVEVRRLNQIEYWNVAPFTASCPTDLLMDTMVIEENQGERSMSVSSESKNWIGLSANTGEVVIKFVNR